MLWHFKGTKHLTRNPVLEIGPLSGLFKRKVQFFLKGLNFEASPNLFKSTNVYWSRVTLVAFALCGEPPSFRSCFGIKQLMQRSTWPSALRSRPQGSTGLQEKVKG